MGGPEKFFTVRPEGKVLFAPVTFRNLTLDKLVIDDERSFRHVGLYADLKRVLIDSGYRFRVAPPDSPASRWDRALFLNLAFWNASEAGDVLTSDHIAADVVTHVAWHHLARSAIEQLEKKSGVRRADETRPSADGLLLGEAIASAFDLYLVGRLLGHSPDSEFLETQVPAMADIAYSTGVSEEAFEDLLDGITQDPERAFEDLRELLFDVCTALVPCHSLDEADVQLERFAHHRFACLLHHYELPVWILHARAYGDKEPDSMARSIDSALRKADVSLEWLEEHWVRPALPAG